MLFLLSYRSNHRQIRIISSKAPSAEKKDKQAFVAGETTDNFKYENYFNLNIPVKFVAHHQVTFRVMRKRLGTFKKISSKSNQGNTIELFVK